MEMIREFFGWTNMREPAGFLSREHLLFVTCLMAFVVFLALYLGKKNRGDENANRKTIRRAAVAILAFEAAKIVVITLRSRDIWAIRGDLPLFLCSINLFTLPIAGFGKGRIRDLALDFLMMYGMLCCFAGTYLAANYYDNNPVLSFDVLDSAATHVIAGFASLYIPVSGMKKPDEKNGLLSLTILIGIEVIAYAVNIWNAPSPYESNYMFLHDPAGTPFTILENLAGGNGTVYTVFAGFTYPLFGLIFVGAEKAVRRFRRGK